MAPDFSHMYDKFPSFGDIISQYDLDTRAIEFLKLVD